MKISGKRIFLKCVAVVMAATLLFACSGPEAKKMKFYGKGKALYAKGDYVRARLELKNAIQIDNRFAAAYSLLGLVELKEGNLGGAFGDLGRATELNPRDYDAQARLGRLWLMQGVQEKALEKAELVLKAQPRHEEALLLRGMLYLAAGDTDRAISHFQEMAQAGVRRPDLYLLLASAHHALKDDKAAESALRQGLAANKDAILLHRALAGLYAGSGRVDEAAAEVRELLRLEPANYSYSLALAGLFWDSGRVALAREILGKLQASSANKEERLFATAAFYLSRKEPGTAEQLLQSGIAENRGSFLLRFALADLYLQSNRREKGIALLKECLSLEKDQTKPRIIDTKNALAQVYLARGELTETSRLLDEIFKVTPRNLDASLTSGRLAMLRGEGDKAAAAFQIIVNEKPRLILGYLLLSDAQLLNRKPAMALETLQQAQKLEPDSRDVLRALARYYARQRDFPTAEGFLRKALAKNPGDLQLQIDLGDLYRGSHDVRQAAAAYAGVTRQSQGAVIGSVRLSDLYLEMGQTERATSELDRAVTLEPRSGELFTRLIRLYAGQSKYAEAVAACRKRIAERPQDALAHILLGEMLGAQGEYREAEESFVRAQQLSGNTMQAALSLAHLQIREGEPQKARRTFEQLLARDPSAWAPANDLACLLADYGNSRGDLERAFTLAKQVSARFPDSPVIMDTLGWVYYRQGDYRRAAELLEKSAARLGNDPLIRYHAGMALYHVGRGDQARAHLRFAAASRESFPGKEEAVRMAAGK